MPIAPTASRAFPTRLLLPVLIILLAGCQQGEEEQDEPSLPSETGLRGTVTPTVRLDGPGVSASIAPILQRVDAASDAGWESEVISAQAQEQLEKMLAGLENPKPRKAADTSRPTLRPHHLISQQRGQLRISRQAELEAHAVTAFSEAIESLRLPFREGAMIKTKLKTIGVTLPQADTFRTEVLYLASGPGEHGPVQQNARWKCTWSASTPHSLRAIEVRDYEEIVPLSGDSLRFQDLTASAFRDAPSFSKQLMRGVDYWRPRLQGDFGVDVNGLQGIAIGDANGDGLEDVFVCQQGGLPNRLYLRQPNGTLRDHSAAANLDWMEVTRAALFIDLDNDGDQDLAMAQGWHWVLMENDGMGVFRKRAETRAPANLHSLAAADYDLDGDLDIFFCGRNPAREFDREEGILGQPMPYHDANNGGANILLRNEGHWQFTDATRTSGLDQNNQRYSYACSWADYNLDGHPDLYVANDFGRNNLYMNNGGTFVDQAGDLGVEDMSAGMGVTWGDYDNNGRPDIYVSNMFSSAGNRITYQRQFRPEASGSIAQFRRHARGNSLFANLAAAGFEDVSMDARVTMARWAWGAKFADLNNDGWEDLYVANGFITTEDTGDL